MALDFLPDWLTEFGWNDEKLEVFLAIVSVLLFFGAIMWVMRCLRLNCSDIICIWCFWEICCTPGGLDLPGGCDPSYLPM